MVLTVADDEDVAVLDDIGLAFQAEEAFVTIVD
jgi:hypothetical protein